MQTITIPAQSVWCVASLTNGDLLAGSSDGIARVFTQEAARAAPADEIQVYNIKRVKHT